MPEDKGPLRRHKYDTVDENETFTIELPNGIGAVHIRTGGKEPRTGYPRIAVEVVSDSIDTPAEDGRYYLTEYSSMLDTLYLVGNPDSVQEGS